MFDVTLSRRSLLTGLGLGLGAVAGMGSSCDIIPPPESSPFLRGRYRAAGLVLGEREGTEALPQFIREDELPIPPDQYYYACPNGALFPLDLPDRILASVYVPRDPPNVRDHRVPPPNPLEIPLGPFPVVLFAHGVRPHQFACETPFPVVRDFTRVHRMLEHVVSYGCVAVVPDLSWLPPDLGSLVTLEEAFSLRARVLLAYYQYLATLNSTLFANQLDLTRVILAGHSTGAGSAATAGRTLTSIINLESLAYAFFAPYFRGLSEPPSVGTDTRNLLVIGGGADPISGVDPANSFAAAGTPKTLVTVPGANHFGYTHLCELDNTCHQTVGSDGTILREGQQSTAAAYLAALLRFHAYGDETALPYLTGERIVEGPEIYGVTGIEVTHEGAP
jgi:pimeloyl-ACP methyl ester carboxylesterase